MKKQNIGVLTFPINEASNTPLSNLVDIVYLLSDDLYLITGNDGYVFFKDDKRIHTHEIKHERGANVFTRIMKYVYTQLKISYKLTKISRNVEIWIFFISGEALLLPMLTAKVLRRKVVLSLVGFPTKVNQIQKDLTAKPADFLSKINLILSNRIVAYSERVVEERGLRKYQNKISIAREHFLNFDKFKIKRKFADRKNTVGFIGTLYKIKGVLNFVQSISEILEKEEKTKFLIGGDGQLRDEIEKYVSKENLNDKVKLTGWIPHDELPEYLNELKLLVLPSYTEGLPNVMLEAMACGTPVIVTDRCGIADVVDGKVGHVVEYDKDQLRDAIIKVLGDDELRRRFGEEGKSFVGKEFGWDKIVRKVEAVYEGCTHGI